MVFGQSRADYTVRPEDPFPIPFIIPRPISPERGNIK
jgi:hypothetical protein